MPFLIFFLCLSSSLYAGKSCDAQATANDKDVWRMSNCLKVLCKDEDVVSNFI